MRGRLIRKKTVISYTTTTVTSYQFESTSTLQTESTVEFATLAMIASFFSLYLLKIRKKK